MGSHNQRMVVKLKAFIRQTGAIPPAGAGVAFVTSNANGWVDYPEGASGATPFSAQRTGVGVTVITLPRVYSLQEHMVIIDLAESGGDVTFSCVPSGSGFVAGTTPTFSILTVTMLAAAVAAEHSFYLTIYKARVAVVAG